MIIELPEEQWKTLTYPGIRKDMYKVSNRGRIKNISKGNIILGDCLKLRILRFWQFTDNWVTFNIMRGTIMCDPPSDIVPEEDYVSD